MSRQFAFVRAVPVPVVLFGRAKVVAVAPYRTKIFVASGTMITPREVSPKSIPINGTVSPIE
jgi:hypothetical protein